MVLHKSLCPCALGENSLSIGRVKMVFKDLCILAYALEESILSIGRVKCCLDEMICFGPFLK